MVDKKDIAQAVLQAVDGLFPESDEVSSANLSPDNLPTILNLLQETIDGVKSEIKHIGESQQAEVAAWIQEARQLHTELSQDHNSLADITQFESRGDKLDDRVRDLSSQQTLLSDELVFNEELVGLLNNLKELQDAVSSSQTYATEGSLDQACGQFEVANGLFDKLADFDQILAVGLMKENLRSLKDGLIHEVEDCWTRLISTNSSESSLTIQDSVPVGSGSIAGSALLNTLDRLGILKEKLDRLHHRITHILIFPRLQPGSGAKQTFVVDNGQSKIQLRRRGRSDLTVGSLYADLKVVLEFLSSKLGPSISHLLARTLSPAILNHLMGSYLPECIPTDLDHFNEFDIILNETSVFEQYLDKAGWLEGNRGELKDWVSRAPRIWLNRRREDALDSLRRAFASGLGQRRRVERIERAKTVDGVLEEMPKPIDTNEDNWDTNWDLEIEEEEESKPKPKPGIPAPKPKSESKPPADEEEDVSGWGFDDDLDIDDAPGETAQDKQNAAPTSKNEEEDENMEWGWGDEDNQTKAERDSHTAHQANGKPKEKDVQDITLIETYSITSMPQEVINIILRAIEEAEKLSLPQYSNLAISSSTSGLLTIPTSILTAYRALSGIFYREDLNPAISIYNDCEWLEERLVELEKDVKSKPGPFATFDLQTGIKSISSFGRRSYWKEMVRYVFFVHPASQHHLLNYPFPIGYQKSNLK
ncbi:hypothetical protein TWF694_004320 [Orbilia ellipsospora]|uniref:Centromere/kinetochore protein zw10 middle domain-containing protein n=1 Tax=Orbilia ellipsospora TaxID=2528407 RepID=A0AAV9WZ03_9PEZI